MRLRPVRTPLAAPALGACATAPTPAPVREAVLERAAAAGFSGAILIGGADGSAVVLTPGPEPAASDAAWRWGSISKPPAAAPAGQETAAGRLDLDAPAARSWPDWRAAHAATIRSPGLPTHDGGLPQPDASLADGDGAPARRP